MPIPSSSSVPGSGTPLVVTTLKMTPAPPTALKPLVVDPVNNIWGGPKLGSAKESKAPEPNVTFWIVALMLSSNTENEPDKGLVLPKKEKLTVVSVISTPTLTPWPPAQPRGSPRQKPNSGPAPTVVVPSEMGRTIAPPVADDVPVTELPMSAAMEGDAKARIAAVANATVASLIIVTGPGEQPDNADCGPQPCKNRAALCTFTVFKGLYRAP